MLTVDEIWCLCELLNKSGVRFGTHPLLTNYGVYVDYIMDLVCDSGHAHCGLRLLNLTVHKHEKFIINTHSA